MLLFNLWLIYDVGIVSGSICVLLQKRAGIPRFIWSLRQLAGRRQWTKWLRNICVCETVRIHRTDNSTDYQLPWCFIPKRSCSSLLNRSYFSQVGEKNGCGFIAVVRRHSKMIHDHVATWFLRDWQYWLQIETHRKFKTLALTIKLFCALFGPNCK